MKDVKNGLWIAALGSLWGLSEVVGGEAFFKDNIPFASVWLAAWAVFLLGIGRGLVNVPGSSAAMAGVAALFKLVNASPYYCHLLGIVCLGLAFDAFATLWLRRGLTSRRRLALTAIAGAFVGYASFAVLIAYVIRYAPWVAGGTDKVLNHVFVSGPLASVAALVLFPIGARVGLRSGAAERRPAWSAAGALALLAALWTIGGLVG